MQILHYNAEDTLQLKKFIKTKLIPSQTLKKFHKCGQEFYRSYVNLISQAKQVERELSSVEEGLFKMIPAEKYLSILKWYEENKHAKDLQILRKEWF